MWRRKNEEKSRKTKVFMELLQYFALVKLDYFDNMLQKNTHVVI